MIYEQQPLEALKLIFIGTRWSRQSATVGDLSRVELRVKLKGRETPSIPS